MNGFHVSRTRNRSGAKDDNIICVNSSIKKRMKLGRFAVVAHNPSVLRRKNTLHNPNFKDKLVVPCRVVVDEKLADSQVRIDETLRNAIGIPFAYHESEPERVGGFMVEIYPLRLSLPQHFRDLFSYIFGRRYLFFRVSPASIPDLEKNLCMIPLHAFKLIGCEPGDKVVLESVSFEKNYFKLRSVKIKAYEAPKHLINKRVEMEEPNIEARYVSATKLLDVSPDIDRIFTDAHIREMLRVNQIDPLRVSRDLSNLFFKQIREFGIIFFLSLLTGTQLFTIKVSWQLFALILLISLTVAFLIILINIRSTVK
jgi:hypothetical protein